MCLVNKLLQYNTNKTFKNLHLDGSEFIIQDSAVKLKFKKPNLLNEEWLF
jgi:hypothetical protein